MPTAIPGLVRVDHAAITVPDLEAAVRFYSEVLGAVDLYRLGPFDARQLPPTPDGRDWTEAHLNVADGRLRLAMLRLGDFLLELFEYTRPGDARTEPPRNCDAGGHHLAFQVRDLSEAVGFLESRGLRVMCGPIPVSTPVGRELRVQYFLDPWGNQLELVQQL